MHSIILLLRIFWENNYSYYKNDENKKTVQQQIRFIVETFYWLRGKKKHILVIWDIKQRNVTFEKTRWVKKYIYNIEFDIKTEDDSKIAHWEHVDH